jgi:hypothetical protein
MKFLTFIRMARGSTKKFRKWSKYVSEVHSELKRKNRSSSLKNAMKEASRRKRRGEFVLGGGGWGFLGAQSASGVPGTVNNDVVFTNIGDCRAAKPGYFIDPPYPQKGLPGMGGGRRKTRRNRKQAGGRYGFDPAAIQGVTPNGATPWAGTYSPIQRITCEGSTPNPLNPGPHTPSTQPPGAAPAVQQVSLSGFNQGGGGSVVGSPYVTLAGDTVAYYAPTAGYTNRPSDWVDSVGAPVLLQPPYAARAMNPACLTTGGGKKSRKQRKQRKQRKHRKA